jgi:hypothetical protein
MISMAGACKGPPASTRDTSGIKAAEQFIASNFGESSGYLSNTPVSMISRFSFKVHIREPAVSQDMLVGVDGRSVALAVLSPTDEVCAYCGNGFFFRSGADPIAVTGVWPNMTITLQPDHGLIYEFSSKGARESPKFFFADIGGLTRDLVRRATSANVQPNSMLVHCAPDGDLTIELDPVKSLTQRFAIRRLKLSEAEAGMSFEISDLTLGECRIRTDLDLSSVIRANPKVKVCTYDDKKAVIDLGHKFSLEPEITSDNHLTSLVRNDSATTRAAPDTRPVRAITTK